MALAAIATAVRDVTTVLDELANAGFAPSDRLPLRYRFEAPTLRTAVELTSALRIERECRVQIRTAPRRVTRAHRWQVSATTPPVPLLRVVVELWEDRMRLAVRKHLGCALVGWEPVVTPAPR